MWSSPPDVGGSDNDKGSQRDEHVCELCDKRYRSPQQLEEHLQPKKHLARTKRAGCRGLQRATTHLQPHNEALPDNVNLGRFHLPGALFDIVLGHAVWRRLVMRALSFQNASPVPR